MQLRAIRIILQRRWERIRQKSKRISFPGFDGIPLFDVALLFFNGMRSHSISTRAAAVAYNFYLAFFPTLIFLFTLIPYVPIDSFQDNMLNLIHELLPANAMDNLKNTLEDVVIRKHTSLLSFSIASILFFATNGINAVIAAFNSSAHFDENRSWWRQRLIALWLVVLVSIMLVIGVALWGATQVIVSFIESQRWIEYMPAVPWLLMGRWLVIMLLFFIAISTIYYMAPAKINRWHFFSIGSVVATVSSLAISLGFSTYVNNFGRYNQLYGSIGTMMVIMLWIYFNAFVLLLGYDLNASLKRASIDRDDHEINI